MAKGLITFDQYVQEKGFDNKTVNRFWKYCNQDIPNKETGDVEWWGSEATNHNDMRGYSEEFDELFEEFKNINSSKKIQSSHQIKSNNFVIRTANGNYLRSPFLHTPSHSIWTKDFDCACHFEDEFDMKNYVYELAADGHSMPNTYTKIDAKTGEELGTIESSKRIQSSQTPQAELEGYNCGHKGGGDLNDNPYDKDTQNEQWDDWRRGYSEGDEDRIHSSRQIKSSKSQEEFENLVIDIENRLGVNVEHSNIFNLPVELTYEDECYIDDICREQNCRFVPVNGSRRQYRLIQSSRRNNMIKSALDTWVDPRSKVDGWKVKVLDVYPDEYAGSTTAKVEIFDPDGNSQGEDIIYIHRQDVKIGETYDARYDGVMCTPRIKGVEDISYNEIPDMKNVTRERYLKSALDTVKVTFDNGDTIVTDYNADVGREEIAKYYMHNYFNVGGEDEMHQVVKVEFPGNINSARTPEVADMQDAEDIALFAENDVELYNTVIKPTFDNLQRKLKRGIYDKNKALIAWEHVIDEAAKAYDRQLGSRRGTMTMFNKATRKEAAKILMDSIWDEDEWQA